MDALEAVLLQGYALTGVSSAAGQVIVTQGYAKPIFLITRRRRQEQFSFQPRAGFLLRRSVGITTRAGDQFRSRRHTDFTTEKDPQ